MLREIDMGDWEDIPWAELPRIWPEEYAVWRARPWDAVPPHGESVMQAGQRMLDGVRRLVAEHEGQQIAVVTHGSAIRGALTIAHGFAPCLLYTSNPGPPGRPGPRPARREHHVVHQGVQ